MICLLNYLVHIRYVLLMREDLTVNFARAIARCGLAANNVKRYDIDTVYNESDAGWVEGFFYLISIIEITNITRFQSGQPTESLEAAFDIIQDTFNIEPELMEAEAMLVICRVMGLLSPKHDTRIIEVPPIILKSPIWFLRLSHTRLSDGKLRACFIWLIAQHTHRTISLDILPWHSYYGFIDRA
jgi:hypothetical protein